MEILILSESGSNEDKHTTRLAKMAVQKGHSVKVLPLKGYAILPHNGQFRAMYKGQEYRGDVILPRIKSPDMQWCQPLIQVLESQYPLAVGTMQGFGICHDKMATFLTLFAANIPTPKTLMVSHEWQLETAFSFIDMTHGICIKAADGAEGASVFIFEDLPRIGMLNSVVKTLLASSPILLQERIPYQHDIRVLVFEDDVYVAGKRIPAKGESRANISLGGTYEPITLTNEQELLAVKASRACYMKAGAIDLLVDYHGKTWVLEVNVSPGFLIDDLLGTDVAGMYIEHALKIAREV